MYPPPPPRVYRLKTDRPRRTGQGLKLTLAALLTALALQPDASAQSFAVGNLTRGGGGHSFDIRTPAAMQFTVGPPPEGLTGWTLDKITGRFRGVTGNPSGFEARILNDVSGSPGPLDSPLATLTGPDPRGRDVNYDFLPLAGTTISLEPETSYWLAYTSAGLPSASDTYRANIITVVGDDAESLSGWSIGDDLWVYENELWRTLRSGGSTRIPMKFGVFATPVPEPSEYALFFALGLGAFALWHRRRQQRQRAAA
ncbi:MAG: hypothetical protein M2R46_05572 [Verrucomicrobia subdivision 3 bacterium]|nr:hypothetical protein [Limisphaerales bacterium]